ncbi:hypothetical protein MKW92_033777 [Papaver armeniacum]|nr:hypothetical protein MKW92_033777 [Papaver armeniacum]
MKKENQIIKMEEEDVEELAPFDSPKNKNPVSPDSLIEENDDAKEDLDEEGEGIVLQNPFEGTDRSYEHEEYPNAWLVLGRVFHILRENNPELAADKYRLVMRPPQVLREGTMDFCETHVMTFDFFEMGTSGSLDGQQRLFVKGSFALKNFEGILQRYHNEYVICNGCKSPNTILSKENMHSFLVCKKGMVSCVYDAVGRALLSLKSGD